MFHNPIYAGTYAYGRRAVNRKSIYAGRRWPGGQFVPMEKWKVTLHDHLPAYITLDQYRANLERLRQNCSRANAMGAAAQGSMHSWPDFVYYAKCGNRMAVSYSRSRPDSPGIMRARYDCHRFRQRGEERTCYGASASAIDALIVQQIHRALEPASLELSLRASQDLAHERERLSLHWRQQIEDAPLRVRQGRTALPCCRSGEQVGRGNAGTSLGASPG